MGMGSSRVGGYGVVVGWVGMGSSRVDEYG